jgi:hypothetical protein
MTFDVIERNSCNCCYSKTRPLGEWKIGENRQLLLVMRNCSISLVLLQSSTSQIAHNKIDKTEIGDTKTPPLRQQQQ